MNVFNELNLDAQISIEDLNNFETIAAVSRNCFNKIENEIAFNIRWENGTGYFNLAVLKDIQEQPSKTADPHGRKIILLPVIGDSYQLVFFERHTTGDRICVNAPVGFSRHGIEIESKNLYTTGDTVFEYEADRPTECLKALVALHNSLI